MSSPRHLLTLADLTGDEFRRIITRAIELKALQREGTAHAR